MTLVFRPPVQPLKEERGEPYGFEESWKPILGAADRALLGLERAVARALTPASGLSTRLLAILARAVEAGYDATEITERIVRLIPMNRLEEVLDESLTRVAQDSASSVPQSPKIRGRLDLEMVNELAVDWAKENSAALVREITQDQRSRVIDMVTRHTGGHLTRAEAIRGIYVTVGLTARQGRAVDAFRARQLGLGRTPEQADILSARYAGKLRLKRARLISRTEAVRASNMGQQLLWEQAGRQRLIDTAQTVKVWIITPDDKLCPACGKMKGVAVPVNSQFIYDGTPIESPPAHPACRCAMALQNIQAPQLTLVDEEALSFHLGGGHDQKKHGRRGPGGLLDRFRPQEAPRAASKTPDLDAIEAGRPLGRAIRAKLAPLVKKEAEAWDAFKQSEGRQVAAHVGLAGAPKIAIRTGAPSPERIAAREAYRKAWAASANTERALARETVKAISAVRPLGGDFTHKQLPSDRYYTNDPGSWDLWKSGFGNMPRDWAKASAAEPLAVRWVKGSQKSYYYDGSGGLAPHVGLAKPYTPGDNASAVHEIGHRMSHISPGVRAAERAFYERRTKGSALEPMGGDMKSLRTRPDAFPHRYVGVAYPGRWQAYEVLSMGLQGLLAPGSTSMKIIRDPEYMDFVLGVMATL